MPRTGSRARLLPALFARWSRPRSCSALGNASASRTRWTNFGFLGQGAWPTARGLMPNAPGGSGTPYSPKSPPDPGPFPPGWAGRFIHIGTFRHPLSVHSGKTRLKPNPRQQAWFPTLERNLMIQPGLDEKWTNLAREPLISRFSSISTHFSFEKLDGVGRWDTRYPRLTCGNVRCPTFEIRTFSKVGQAETP